MELEQLHFFTAPFLFMPGAKFCFAARCIGDTDTPGWGYGQRKRSQKALEKASEKKCIYHP
ncbi:hypothetical protein K420107F6_07570 [Lactonifactor longoviformis]